MRAARILDAAVDPAPQDLPGGQLLDFRKQIILAQYLVKFAVRLLFHRLHLILTDKRPDQHEHEVRRSIAAVRWSDLDNC
jgi:hypothetical protein